MEYRNLDVTIISARNLEDVRTFLLMKVYAVVSIVGDGSNQVEVTEVDEDGETNPTWNSEFRFRVAETAVRREGVRLMIELFCRRTFLDDKYVGEVNIPLDKLFAYRKSSNLKTYKVLRSSGSRGAAFGKLNISYAFSKKISPPQGPAVARRTGNRSRRRRDVIGGVRGGRAQGADISVEFNQLVIEVNNTTQDEDDDEDYPEEDPDAEAEEEDDDEYSEEDPDDEDEDDEDDDDEDDVDEEEEGEENEDEEFEPEEDEDEDEDDEEEEEW